MATKYPKYFLTSALAADGDKAIPPAKADEAGEGRFSQEKGWGEINSTPLDDGGIAPSREDFNGALYLLSQFLLWYQQGGVMNYNMMLAYEVGNEVLCEGHKYRALKPSGGGGSIPYVYPLSSREYWKNLDVHITPGAIMPFANVKLGGSDGRRPIFWGETSADESWVLCDGKEEEVTFNGHDFITVTVPNLIGKFIRGGNVADEGKTGGQDTVTLTTKELPAHNHAVSMNSAGSHNHTRGTQNITGTFPACMEDQYLPTPQGAFFFNGLAWEAPGGGNKGNWLMNFDASRSWSGSTSSNGSHTHSASIGSTGKGDAFNNLPSYYTLAYFMKLPEI